MNQDQKHYKPGSPIPMEFNDPGLRKREMPPKRKKESGNISGNIAHDYHRNRLCHSVVFLDIMTNRR